MDEHTPSLQLLSSLCASPDTTKGLTVEADVAKVHDVADVSN
jgi:hypothetical protein